MRKKLTDLALSKIPDSDTRYTIWDAELRGFGIRVYKGKTFVLKQGNRWYTLGKYPQCSLKQCRDEAKRRLALKYFPDTSVQAPEAAKQYLEHIKTERRSATLHVYETYLKRLPNKPLTNITAAELYNALPEGKSAANLCFSTFKAFFSWCVERDLMPANPLLKKKQPNKLKSRDRLLTDEEVRLIWKESYRHNHFGAIVRLLILSGQRLNQISSLQSTWVNHASQVVVWPAYIMKGGVEHSLPITPLALQALRQLPAYTLQADYQLIGRETLSNSLPATLHPSPNSSIFPKIHIGTAMEKFRKALNKRNATPGAPLDIPHFTLHDFRRYLSSTMAKLGVKQEVVEKILAHKTGGAISPIAQIYNRHSYEVEIRAALTLYESHLTRIIRE